MKKRNKTKLKKNQIRKLFNVTTALIVSFSILSGCSIVLTPDQKQEAEEEQKKKEENSRLYKIKQGDVTATITKDADGGSYLWVIKAEKGTVQTVEVTYTHELADFLQSNTDARNDYIRGVEVQGYFTAKDKQGITEDYRYDENTGKETAHMSVDLKEIDYRTFQSLGEGIKADQISRKSFKKRKYIKFYQVYKKDADSVSESFD